MEAPKPVTTTREAVSYQLLSEVLRLSGTARIRVFGSSMLPAILPGDILIIGRAKLDSAIPGDIVFFKRDDRLFVHRLIGKQDRKGIPCLVTAGDSLAENDPPVLPRELLGRVTSIVRGQRLVSPHTTTFRRLTSIVLRNSDFLKSCLLWLLCRTRSFRGTTECPT